MAIVPDDHDVVPPHRALTTQTDKSGQSGSLLTIYDRPWGSFGISGDIFTGRGGARVVTKALLGTTMFYSLQAALEVFGHSLPDGGLAGEITRLLDTGINASRFPSLSGSSNLLTDAGIEVAKSVAGWSAAAATIRAVDNVSGGGLARTGIISRQQTHMMRALKHN